MEFFTQRHGMRADRQKTYDISVDVYKLLFNICEKYKDHLAWKFPKECRDGHGCCGLDLDRFCLDIKFVIPDLFMHDGIPAVPDTHWSVFEPDVVEIEEYNQYALLDYIEYIGKYSRDYRKGCSSHFEDNRLLFNKESNSIYKDFQSEINDAFNNTGVLYTLSDDGEIERVLIDSPLSVDIEEQIEEVGEEGLKDLLQKAIFLFKCPSFEERKNATEKLWDAFERLKTYYVNMDKKSSAEKIVADISMGNDGLRELIDTEFKVLTKIGNTYRIRHHETDKFEIPDSRINDYFFNRCLSVIALSLKYLQ